MITYNQLKEMVSLQEQLEILLDGENWRDKGHNYRLCIFMETAELIDCFPWKHWKDIQSVADMDAVAGEIVDIWHFAMAFLLQSNKELDVAEMREQINETWQTYEEGPTLEELCIGLTFSLYAKNTFMWGNFIGLLRMANMTFEDLYVLYISKNVLNVFRQDFGYKDGTYIKTWGGKEDVEHLRELTNELLKQNEYKFASLYDSLRTRYQLLTKA